MPSQHKATRQAVTFRLDREVLTSARTTAAGRGETLTAVVERALRAYGEQLTGDPVAEVEQLRGAQE